RLRFARFDLAIDAQGLTKSAVVAWLSGARRRIGFGRPWGRELSRLLNNECVDTTRPHAVDRNLELLRPLGIETPAVRFDVPERPSDRVAAENWLRSCGVDDGFVALAPGAGWPSKLWPVSRFATVAAHLAHECKLPVLTIWGSAREQAWAAEIASAAGKLGRLGPRWTLAQLAAVVRRAKVFVGCDSGPLHLAAAVGTPCVGLYGPWPAEKHGPYGLGHIAVQKKVCPGSTRQRRLASSEYMDAISVADVCQACDEILARSGGPPATALVPPRV
ncbi:MAG: glycosyltransferase family 9 protein, partial [Planctomycetota bacterium]